MWVKVTCWGKLVETANQCLRKGPQVLVEADRFEFDLETGGPQVFTRNDGSADANYDVTARVVRFVGSRSTGGNNVPAEQSEEEEVIPF